jgi:hypothetical protein
VRPTRSLKSGLIFTKTCIKDQGPPLRLHKAAQKAQLIASIQCAFCASLWRFNTVEAAYQDKVVQPSTGAIKLSALFNNLNDPEQELHCGELGTVLGVTVGAALRGRPSFEARIIREWGALIMVLQTAGHPLPRCV